MWGAILGAAATIGSALFSSKSSSDANNAAIKSQMLANQGNIDLAKYNNNFNYEMWQRNNNYNSPASQMARYREAGLNPALIYGTSGISGNSSSPVHGTPAHIDALPARDLTGAVGAISQGIRQTIDTLSQIEDIRSKKLGNSYLQYKVNYADEMMNQGLASVKLNNRWLEGSLPNRLSKLHWDTLNSATLFNRNQNYLLNWMDKDMSSQLDLRKSQNANVKSQKWYRDLVAQDFTLGASLRQRQRQYEMNNLDFLDNNLFRYLDKGFSYLDKILDMFNIGKKIFGKKPRLSSTESGGSRGYGYTNYNYE